VSLLAELKRRNVLRVAAAYLAIAWLVIQVVETLFPLFGLGDAAARAVVIVLAIGFVPVVILSWVFELTPKGFRRDSEVDHAAAEAVATGKRLDRIVIVALVLAVGYFAVDKFVFDPMRDAAIRREAREEGRSQAVIGAYDKSIVVLPFADMSPAGDQAWLGEGVADQLLNQLAQIPQLRVISRSSAFAVAAEGLDVPDIAQRLSVSHVLEGSVQIVGDKIRVTAQLIDAHSDTHAWSDKYDRPVGDIFSIQDEVAAAIVEELQIALLQGSPRAPRASDPEAMKLTMQANHLDWSEAGDTVDTQVALLEEALAIDPDYVPALFALGSRLWELSKRAGADREALFRRMQGLTRRMAAVAPDDPKVLVSVGWDAYQYDGDLETAADAISRAVERAPSDIDVLTIASGFGERIEAYDAVLAIRERTLRVDPGCIGCLGLLARAYANLGRYDEAMQAIDEYSRLVPGQRLWTKAMLHLLRGEPAAALAIFEGEYMSEDNRQVGRAMALAELGREDEARAALERQIREFADVNPTGVATAYAWLGDYDAAFEWLNRIVDERGAMAVVAEMTLPEWFKLREHPRWGKFAVRLNLDPARIANLDFNPKLPD